MAKCLSCGRYIWSARSRAAGRGSGCQARYRRAVRAAAALPEFRPWQVGKAREHIEDRAIVPAAREGVFVSVSGDGERTYAHGTDWCPCDANGICYHRVAAVILSAA
jgi:hypothetical protein